MCMCYSPSDRFLRVSKSMDDAAIVDVQNSIPELQDNPFIATVLRHFDKNKDGRITLHEFTTALD